jgi:hypothetical protein
MSWAKGLGAALKGTLTGLAEAAEAEDEKRSELTKVALAQRIKMRDEALALQKTQEEKVKEQNEFIKIFSGGNFLYEDKKTKTLNGLSEADAIALYKQSSGDIEKARKLIEDENFTLKGNGTVYTPKSAIAFSSTKDSTLAALKPKVKSGGILQEGRWEQIADMVANTLGEETIEIPALKEVEGVQITIGKGTDIEYDYTDTLMYVINPTTGLPIEQIGRRVITDKNNPTERQVIHYDLRTNEKITLGADVSLASAAEAFNPESNFKDYGFALDVNTNKPLKDKDGNYMSVYQGKDGKFYPNINGKPSNTPLDKSVIIISSDALAGAGGIEQFVQKLSNVAGLPEFHTAGAVVDNQKRLMSNFTSETIDMMRLNKEIGAAGYSMGGVFTQAISTGINAVESTAAFLQDFATRGETLSPEERFRLLSQNQDVMQEFVNNEKSILEGLDSAKRRSVQILLLKTKGSLAAYQTAQITTEDPRITDQDFNIFQTTILGDNPSKTFALLKDASERALRTYNTNISILEEKRNAINKASLARGTLYTVENLYVTNDPDSEFNPDNIRAKLDSAYANFDPNEKSLGSAVLMPNAIGEEVPVDAQTVRVNPETGELATDGGEEMMVLYVNGKPAKYAGTNRVVAVRDGTRQELINYYSGLSKQGLID